MPALSRLAPIGGGQGDRVQRKLGFEFEILVQTDTEGTDKDPLTRVVEKDPLADLLGMDRQEIFKVVSDKSRKVAVEDKKDFKKLPKKHRNSKILEIVTAPVDEFAFGARDRLGKQMDSIVHYAGAIDEATKNLTKPASLQAINKRYLELIKDTEEVKPTEEDVVIGRDQKALEKSAGRKGVTASVQDLGASIHYTVGIDFAKLPEYLTALSKNAETRNPKRGPSGKKVRQRKLLSDVPGLADQLMGSGAVKDLDLKGAAAEVKGFFSSVLLNLVFGHGYDEGLDKNFSPILSRTDGVKVLDAIEVKATGVKNELKGNWGAIQAKIKSLTGRDGSEEVLEGWKKFPTVDKYLDNLINASSDGFVSKFGGHKKMGPEDVGSGSPGQRAQGIIYENRATRPTDADRYPPKEWKPLAFRIFDAVKEVNLTKADKEKAKILALFDQE